MFNVFVSSTFSDLISERDAVISYLDGIDDVKVICMERFGSRDKRPTETCLELLQTCDLYIGIIGKRYGSVDEELKQSMVEIEYDAAHDIPRLMFISSENYMIPADIEEDIEKQGRLRKFRNKVLSKETCEFFDDKTHLALSVAQALTNWKSAVGSAQAILKCLRPGYVSFIARGLNHTFKYGFLLTENRNIHISLPQSETLFTEFFVCQANSNIRFDFINGNLPIGIKKCSRSSRATIPGSENFDLVEVGPDEARFTNFAPGLKALVLEPQKTNFLHENLSPRSRDITLSPEWYTLWCVGTGSVKAASAANPGWRDIGAADASNPLVFSINDLKGVRVTVRGDVKCFQLENGVTPTSLIASGQATVTRTADAIQLSIMEGLYVSQ